jgi:hypothetical protein
MPGNNPTGINQYTKRGGSAKPKAGKFGRSGSAAEQLKKYGKGTDNSVANRRAALTSGTSKSAAVKAQRAANRNPTSKKAARAAMNAHFKVQAENVKSINAYEKKHRK